MPIFPLSDEYREVLVDRLDQLVSGRDPLRFLQEKIFKPYPEHVGRIPLLLGRPPTDFYRDVVRYCEMSAWSEEPALIIALLSAFIPVWQYESNIDTIRNGGPFRCHPPGYPYHVCRVAAELPLLGRRKTRAAALYFDRKYSLNGQPGKRVLRVRGPTTSGKTYTLNFFRYLAAIQPLQLGILHIDFGEKEMVTQAAGAEIPIELFLAQRLEAQVRRRRAELRPAPPPALGNGLSTLTLDAEVQQPYVLQPLSDLQQRTRWTRELVNVFVDQVLFRLDPTPRWWVLVVDNCEKTPPEAHEFVRRLVERAAGIPTTAEDADKGPLRVVLLGDSDVLMPNPVYQDHIVNEDLEGQILGAAEVQEYFRVLCLCRGILLDEAHLQALADESVAHAQEIVHKAHDSPPPWPCALAAAIIEKTLSLEALAAQKRSGQ
jgi:hypothetical protein